MSETTIAYSPVVGASTSPNGPFIVVWGQSVGYPAPVSLHARRFDHEATPVGDVLLVSNDDDVFYGPTSVAVAPDGSFIAAWRVGDRDNAVRAFDAAGAPRGDRFAPGTDAAGPRYLAQVTTLPNLGFVVVWDEVYDGSGYTGTTRVAARRIDSSGSPAGTQFTVASGSVPEYADSGLVAVRSPSAAAVGPGEFVVVWEHINDSYWYGDSSGLARTRVATSGLAASLSYLRFEESDGQGEHFEGDAQVATDLLGNSTVVWNAASGCGSGWYDQGPPGCYYRNDGIGMSRFDVDGRALPATSPVNVFDNEGQWDPVVAMSPSGDFVVAWTSGPTPDPEKSPNVAPPQDGDGTGVFLRAFDCAGTPLGDADVQVNQWTTGGQYGPSVAISASGHLLVTWSAWLGGNDARAFARAFRFDPQCPLCGDADANGEIRISDALQALRAGVGLGSCSQRRCDVDADGNVTSGDALDILIWSVGRRAKLRCDPSLPDV